jgi:hypothetical protein
MEEQYVLALYEGDPDYLQTIEYELLLAMAKESIDPLETEAEELPF